MSDDIPQDDEPLFALREANSLEKFDQRMSDLIEFASTVYISSEVRDQCIAELEAAKKTHYKIPKV
jgi:K+/H+ antiporter YhaU regulatory subunit KhtT